MLKWRLGEESVAFSIPLLSYLEHLLFFPASIPRRLGLSVLSFLFFCTSLDLTCVSAFKASMEASVYKC